MFISLNFAVQRCFVWTTCILMSIIGWFWFYDNLCTYFEVIITSPSSKSSSQGLHETWQLISLSKHSTICSILPPKGSTLWTNLSLIIIILFIIIIIAHHLIFTVMCVLDKLGKSLYRNNLKLIEKLSLPVEHGGKPVDYQPSLHGHQS